MDYLADVIERNYRATFKTTTLLTRVGDASSESPQCRSFALRRS